jgi:hypothetical protein
MNLIEGNPMLFKKKRKQVKDAKYKIDDYVNFRYKNELYFGFIYESFLNEEGEVIYNDYVYSRRLKVPKKDYETLGLKGKKEYTYADAATAIQKESEERPNDPLSKNNMKAMFARL